jgi:hypothetical protein
METTQKLIYFESRILSRHLSAVQRALNGDNFVNYPSIHAITKDIPVAMTTTHREEADIIVDVIADKTQVGRYSNTATQAYQSTCLIRIINVRNGAVLASRRFWGSEPPQKIQLSTKSQWQMGSQAGDYPYETMRQYLNRKILDQRIYLREGVPPRIKALWSCLIVIVGAVAVVAILSYILG